MKMFFPLTALMLAAAFAVSNANADNARSGSTAVRGTASSLSNDSGSRTGVNHGTDRNSAGISTNRPADPRTPAARTNRTGSNPMNANDRTTNTSRPRR